MRALQAFIDFATCQSDLLTQKNKASQLDREIVELDYQIAQLKKSLDDAKQKVFELRKQLDFYELELKVIDGQESEKKQRLDLAGSVKEYQSLLNELEVLAEKKATYENHIFTLWSLLETTEQAVQELIVVTNVQVDKLHKQIQDYSAQKQAVVQTIKELEQECQKREAHVAPDLLERYKTMQARIQNPAAAVLQDSCTGCFAALPHHDLSKLRRGELIQCQECYRLLYFASGYHG